MDDLSRPDSEFVEAYVELTAVNKHLGGIRAIERFLPEDAKSVLDVASGGCDVGEALAISRNCRVVSLDMNSRGLKRAERTTPVVGDALQLPFADGTFDAVISARALHHFTENQRRRAIFKEIFDLVRSGGGFINADNVRGATKSLSERYRCARDEYLDRYVRESSGGKTSLAEAKAATPSSFHGPHNNGILEEELAWLREAGFHDVDCFWKFTTTVVYGGFKN